MMLDLLRFLVDRYEVFHKVIRKKEFSVDRDGLTKFYSILFFVLGVPLLIGAIIGFVVPDIFELFSIWLSLAVAVIGIMGILYSNVSNRFIKPLENKANLSFQE